jgi:hypothetical protein
MDNIVYDLTHQWILEDGPFRYDYGWLSQAYSKEEMANAAKAAFEHLYGAAPDTFEILA